MGHDAPAHPSQSVFFYTLLEPSPDFERTDGADGLVRESSNIKTQFLSPPRILSIASPR
jgi:hypothetical protein